MGAGVGAGVALVRSSTFTDWVGRLPSAPWLMSVSTAPLCPAMSLRPASRSSVEAIRFWVCWVSSSSSASRAVVVSVLPPAVWAEPDPWPLPARAAVSAV